MKNKLIAISVVAALTAAAYAYTQCPICKGTGWEKERKCQFCNGTGKVGVGQASQ